MTTPSHADIAEQAESLRRTASAVAAMPFELTADRPWVFVGCGASFHAATAAAALAGALWRVPALAAPASDLWMNPDVWLRPDAVVVGISRTGSTTETVEALRAARDAGATTVAVSLTPGTAAVEESDVAVVLDHVGERARVMTRSFTNMLIACQTLVVRAARAGGARVSSADLDEYAEGLLELGAAVAAGQDEYERAATAAAAAGSGHVVFLGSGPDVGIARQAALQTQETSGAAVEAHAVLDYRHGPLASLTPESTVVVMTGQRSLDADLVLAEDIGTLGGSLVAVGPADVVDRFPNHVRTVTTPGQHPLWLNAVAALPFLQAFGYQLTLARGADPESVHNLDRTKQPHVNPHVLPESLFASESGDRVGV